MRPLFLLLLSATLAHAGGWELHEYPKTGRQVATSTVTGTGPQGPVKATLVFHHRRGQPLQVVKKGEVTELPIIVELCVDAFESVKGFDFLAFEGPDSTAAEKRFVSLTIKSDQELFTKRFTQGGWINQLAWLIQPGTPEPADSAKAPHDFTFGIGNPTRDLKDLITITKLLQSSPSKLEVTVTDSKNPQHLLRFAFPTDNAPEIFRKLMR